jgi:tetratricopeptide (TPR) repeat protein
LEGAVKAFEAALQVSTRERDRLAWANLQNALGKVLRDLGTREEGTQRLEGAVKAFEAALQVYTLEGERDVWAVAQFDLGGVLSALGKREKGTHRLEDAVKAYEVTLQWASRKGEGDFLVLVQLNSGNTLLVLGERTRLSKYICEALDRHVSAWKTLSTRPDSLASLTSVLREAIENDIAELGLLSDPIAAQCRERGRMALK